MNSKKIKPRYVAIFAIFLLLVTVALVTPIVASHFLVRWLQDQGADNAAVESLSMNFFLGRITVRELQAGRKVGNEFRIGEASIDLSWIDLLKGRIHVEKLHLENTVISLQRSPAAIRIGELEFPMQAPDKNNDNESAVPPLGLSELLINDLRLSYVDDTLDEEVVVHQLLLSEAYAWQPELAGHVSVDLTLFNGNLSSQVEVFPFAAEPSLVLELTASALQLGQVKYLLPESISDIGGTLDVNSRTELKLSGDQIKLKASVNLTFNDPRITADQISLSADQVEGDFDLNTELISQSNHQANGNLDIQQPVVAIATGEIARADSFSLTDINFSQQQDIHISARQTNVLNIQLLRDFSEVENRLTSLNIGETVFRTRKDDAPTLDIAEISLNGVALHLSRNESGQFLYQDVISGLVSNEQDSDQSPSALVTVAKLTMASAKLEIEDHAVQPAVLVALDPVNFQAEHFSTLAGADPMAVELDVRQGDLTSVTMRATIDPNTERPTAQIETFKVEGLQLPQFTAYLSPYRLQRGRLAMTSQGSVVQGIVDLQNDLLIEELRMEAGSTQDPLSASLSMPLDVAIDLLRDNQGRIKLMVPVNGDLTKPEVGMRDIIGTALGKSMQKAALSFVKNALQPLGMIMFAADLANKSMRPRFEPATFVAGESSLSDQTTAYLDKIAKLLQDRASLVVSACGVATSADKAVLLARKQAALEESLRQVPTEDQPVSEDTPELVVGNPALIELANQRADNVRYYLVQTRALGSDRVYACPSEIDEGEGAKAVVELTL